MNRQLLLAKRPVGLPDEDTWELVETAVPEPQDGDFLVKQFYISLDPAMRGWMNDSRSYIPPIQIGEVMRAGSVGKVVASNHPTISVGDYVSGWGGVQDYVVSNGGGWFPVQPDIAPLPVFIGTLGMPGMTAYFGLLDIGQPKEGETVLVSGAAGAVGSLVGQIAKIKGCRAVGIAGGPEKCAYLLNELGLDGAIDYKNDNLYKAMKRECPDGIDVYFDNVGGQILNTALTQINRNARIPICGAISQYNATEAVPGPSNYLSLLINRARMEGFLVSDFSSRYMQAAMEMGGWMAQGKLKSREDIYQGIENFRETFLRLFSGDKLGKLVLQLNNEE